MDYTTYGADDFVMDDDFRKWVTKPDEANAGFWEHWLAEHPEKVGEVEIAKAMLMEIEATNPLIKMPEDKSRRIWQAASTAFDAVETPKRRPAIIRLLRQNPFWSAAASIVVIVGIAMIIPLFLPKTETVSTKYGETKQINLPDGSKVTLNGNSKLTFAKHWEGRGNRETWLQGEAFFQVAKIPTTQAKFTVHTSDLSVEVLGTIFNVKQRRENTEVVLEEGKIKLQLHQVDTATILMKPGELVSYSARKQRLDLEKVKPTTNTSWKDGILIFDGMALKDIATVIEDNYGVRIEIPDSSLAQRRMHGAGPADRMPLLFKALEETFTLTIIKKPNSNAYEFRSLTE